MLVTGYQLREALRHWRTTYEAIRQDMGDALYYFEEEEKPLPQNMSKTIMATAVAVGNLEVAQQRYNDSIDIDIMGETKSLGFAIKMIGMVSQHAFDCKKLVSGNKNAYYDRFEKTRNKDEVSAKRSISKEDAKSLFTKSSKIAADLRQKIALSNAEKREIDIPEDLINFGN